ncbi:lasso peptide biosynthesis B2 protein [Erythrobacter sp. JK5]|uniref:lasso peptide biosynthesis B2 protein n=1 Tax=Erythrobacter sp. JK5 TaxID=2829500 RepID=UPI001BADBB5D|nr:lasso peptide biosynthesis B2 protein [Erythrobacter sp. JK5]QUL37820.1 lasso peptide biosynthesis B2 protein [Erythrobacter sp. JK5]
MLGKALELFPALGRKLRTAAGLPIATVGLTGAVWVLLWPARLAVAIFPLRRLVRFYGRDHGARVVIPEASSRELDLARQIGEAIAIAVRYSPASANCYPQALVARALLRWRRVPHGLFFGLRRGSDDKEMEAHAWVMVGDCAVSGGNSFDQYTVVRCFSSPGVR